MAAHSPTSWQPAVLIRLPGRADLAGEKISRERNSARSIHLARKRREERYVFKKWSYWQIILTKKEKAGKDRGL